MQGRGSEANLGREEEVEEIKEKKVIRRKKQDWVSKGKEKKKGRPRDKG